MGSVDGETWDALTEEAPGCDDLTTMQVKPEYTDKAYRYFKATTVWPDSTNHMAASQFILSLGEFRIFGSREEVSTRIRSVSISTDAKAITNHIGDTTYVQSYPRRAMAEDHITLTIVAKQEIKDLSVKVAGLPATVQSTDNPLKYTASVTLTESAALANAGKNAEFSIAYQYQEPDSKKWVSGQEVTMTTDGTFVFVSSDEGYINMEGRHYDSSYNNGGEEKKSQEEIEYQIKVLGDNNSTTISDARHSGGDGKGSYIIVDFGENRGVSLSRVEVLGRLSMLGRSTGMYVQGSNDYDFLTKKGTWTSLTRSSLYLEDWQGLKIIDHKYYRCIRFINDGNWYGNMAEIRLYGKETDNPEEVTVDTSALEELIKEAEKKDLTEYQPEGKEEFEKALSEAKKGVLDDTLSQEEVDKLCEQLKTAIENLKLKDKDKVDKSSLEELIKEAEKKDLTEYQPEGKEEFEKALSEAKEGIEAENLSQEEIEKLYNQLKTAMEKLKVKVDKSSLQKLIEEAEKKHLSDYQTEGKSEFEKALSEAKKGVSDDTLSQEEIEKLYNQLKTTMENLKVKDEVDKSSLEELIKEAEKKDLTEYQPEGKEEFEKALSEAKEGIEAENLSQEEIEKLYNQLKVAMENLKLKDKDEVDKSSLEELIKEAEKKDLTEYQPEGKEEFEKALSEAKKGVLDDTLSQEEVDKLCEQLKTAIENLKLRDKDKVDKSSLEELIKEAEKKDLTEYQPEGKEEFEKALSEAKKGVLDDTLSQEEIEKLYKQLKAAMENLKKTEQVVQYYKVVFYSMGGTAIPGMKVAEGDTFAEPIPEREGYTFRGWFVDKNYTEEYNFANPVRNDLVLYAAWYTKPSANGVYLEEVGGQVYTGKAVKPLIKVYDQGRLLVANKDYSVKYNNNINASVAETESGKSSDGYDPAKKPTIEVTGKGNYKAKYKITFDIVAKSLGSKDINISYVDAYTAVSKGKQKISLTVKDENKSLKANRDYTVAYYNADMTSMIEEDDLKNPGNYIMVVAGKEGSNYCGSVKLGFEVVSADGKTLMSKAKITIASKAKKQPYQNGSPIILPDDAVTVKVGKKKLEKDIDYTISYANNCNVGKASLIVTAVSGEGKAYAGSKKVEFQITGTSLSKAKFAGFETTFDYTGSGITQPNVVLTVGSGTEQKTLIEDQDYTVSYSNHKNVGKATVIYTGINGYAGTVKKTYTIKPINIQGNDEIKVNEGKMPIETVYSLRGAEPKIEVRWKDIVLTESEDYILTYSNNKKVTSATETKLPSITVKGKGNFKGVLKNVLTFSIKPQDMFVAAEMGSLTAVCTDFLYLSKKADSYKYNTKVTLYDNGKKMAAANYTVSYTGNAQEDIKSQLSDGKTAEIPVTITANNSNYFGSFEACFRITPKSLKGCKAVIQPQVYTGGEIKLTADALAVKNAEGETLTENKDYVVTGYKNNIKTGSGASVTIQGRGEYSGTATFKFKIEKKALDNN